MSNTIGCPYCGYSYEYTGDPMGEDECTDDEECPECDKRFVVKQKVMWWLETEKYEEKEARFKVQEVKAQEA